MPILLTAKQTNLPTLTGALLTRRATAAERDAALVAIQRANPGLGTGSIRSGTPVVLPPIRSRRVNLTALGTLVSSVPLKTAADQLPSIADRAAESLKRLDQLTGEAVDELETLFAGGLQVGPSRSDVDAIIDTMKARFERAATHAEVLKEAVGRWQADIDVLRDIHDRLGG